MSTRHRTERLALIDAGQSPLGKCDKPKIVVHIIPIASLNPGFKISWHEIEKDHTIIHPFGRSGANKTRLNLDGHLVSVMAPGGCESYFQWFRNGMIETSDTSFLEGDTIYGGQFAGNLDRWTDLYRSNMGKLGIPYPIAVLCSFVGVAGFRLESFNMASAEKIDRDDLIISDALIPEPATNTRTALRPIFDAVWNSAGRIFPDNFWVFL